MTRAQRVRDLTSERAYVLDGAVFVSYRTMALMASGAVRFPIGTQIVPTALVPDPPHRRWAKKHVRRIHRKRLKHGGRAWV